MNTTRSDFATIADAFDAVLTAYEGPTSLKAQLEALHDTSYLGRKILYTEFHPEIDAERDAAYAAAFSLHGWTEDDFTTELGARLGLET